MRLSRRRNGDAWGGLGGYLPKERGHLEVSTDDAWRTWRRVSATLGIVVVSRRALYLLDYVGGDESAQAVRLQPSMIQTGAVDVYTRSDKKRRRQRECG